MNLYCLVVAEVPLCSPARTGNAKYRQVHDNHDGAERNSSIINPMAAYINKITEIRRDQVKWRADQRAPKIRAVSPDIAKEFCQTAEKVN